jgi:HEPN domain-containing protein
MKLQAVRDLEQAAESLRSGRHEWACFASHQTAAKAAKAVHLHLGQEAWGHVVAKLLKELSGSLTLERGRVLDNYYIPTRNPNSHPEGTPFEHYGPLQSQEAYEYASQIIEYART